MNVNLNNQKMSLSTTGKVKHIFDTQEFSSGFTKREFVVTTDETYPQDIKFETIKDKTALLDTLTVGQEVTVSFNLRGSEYQGKYYVNPRAWKIEAGAKSESTPVNSASDDDGDSLPF